jgi:hypothetical protein
MIFSMMEFASNVHQSLTKVFFHLLTMILQMTTAKPAAVFRLSILANVKTAATLYNPAK